MSDDSHDDFHSIEKWFTVLQNFYIEVLATLVPGILFTFSCTCLIILFLAKIGYAQLMLEAVNRDCSLSWTAFAILVTCFISISYAVGGVFYRRTPNYPDNIGAYKHYKRHLDDKDLMVVFEGNNKFQDRPIQMMLWKLTLCRIFKNPFPHEFDYPYPNIVNYLRSRGMDWLVKYCPWAGKGRQTRHNINLLKQNIRSVGWGSMAFDTVRNESHVRMMSALWYEVLCLRALSIVFFILVYVSKCSLSAFAKNELIIVFCVWVFFWYALYSIEYGIHNMRMRELIMVLQYSYLLDTFSEKVRSGAVKLSEIRPTAMLDVDLFENLKQKSGTKCSHA